MVVHGVEKMKINATSFHFTKFSFTYLCVVYRRSLQCMNFSVYEENQAVYDIDISCVPPGPYPSVRIVKGFLYPQFGTFSKEQLVMLL